MSESYASERHTKNVIDLQTWWMGEIQQLTKKVMKEEERRQAKAKANVEKQMGEYRTFADIQDAYGCGVISERKCDKLYSLLEKLNPEPDRLYEMKLELLSELYQIAKRIVEENTNERNQS